MACLHDGELVYFTIDMSPLSSGALKRSRHTSRLCAAGRGARAINTQARVAHQACFTRRSALRSALIGVPLGWGTCATMAANAAPQELSAVPYRSTKVRVVLEI